MVLREDGTPPPNRSVVQGATDMAVRENAIKSKFGTRVDKSKATIQD
eukprot:gene15036-17769_t